MVEHDSEIEEECDLLHAPGHGALLAGGRGLVGLALDAQVHDVVPGTHCTLGQSGKVTVHTAYSVYCIQFTLYTVHTVYSVFNV